ncbi:type VI secretion system tip protein VgrG [Cupriavidus sp. WGtm5]|uniref:type VI secretion system Vgr family protein n=1 Tax=Cupriavidus sp. WGtm5 TaxID=2919926 RepID=UPI0020911FA6|nr:contractile injection system protein, VgrG/Pvc8 family [Cupriavidus sp. WGtm5]MCO4889639.1 type VI secretion system tip protein VgrG [Cupriavidus sp. WGtm5]
MDVTTLYQHLFSAAHRLYALEGEGALGELAVEAWIGREGVSALAESRIVAVSANADIPLDSLLGQRVTLLTTLAGGGQSRRTGLIRQAEKLGADGSLARYRLTVVPWLWLTTQQRNSQVFQNRKLDSIIESVLQPYAPHAQWRYAAGAEARIAAIGERAHVAQFRETDFHFLSRMLAEAGLGYTVVEDEEAPSGHAVVIFADSAQLPEDEESAAGGGIRFHRAHSQESADAIQQLACETRTTVGGVAVTAWDPEAKRAIRGHAPARYVGNVGRAVSPDPYLSVSVSLAPDAASAQRVAEQVIEAVEARALLFTGRASVRTLRSGMRLTVTGWPHLPLQDDDAAGYPLLLDAVEHCGINNLAADTRAALADRMGPLEAALCFDAPPPAPDAAEATPGLLGVLPDHEPLRLAPSQALQAAAREQGYAAIFRAIDARRPWRACVIDVDCPRLYSRSSPLGVHSAIVVGPDGQCQADGNAEHHASPAGEIRVRFHWQRGERADDRSSRWIRVAQRQAGAGMGWQWLPRIGQEVLVKFADDDIDQPFVIGALYNGQGEAGHAPTPGGKTAAAGGDSQSLYTQGTDSAASAQGNLAGGHSPAWHGLGAQPDGHRNAAALTGFKSQEHGCKGYNQLVLDDSDSQLRTQLATTLQSTQLNLGHLIHQQDNRRGSFRGQGFELRTDGHAAVRGQNGLLLTTYRDAATGRALPTGDNAAGIALLRQAGDLVKTLSQGATTHQTQALSTGKDDEAPLQKQTQAASGMVDGQALETAKDDASSGNTTTPGKVPHQAAAMVHLNGRAGLTLVAGQDLQIANGESVALASGQDSNIAVAGQARVHAGQAIGVAAGLSGAGDNNIGLQLTAGQDDIDIQAQHDLLKLAARDDLTVVSANMNVDFAAAKRIRIATAGGASILIEGGNITVECPGAITYKAAQRKFEGAVNSAYALPEFPQAPMSYKPMEFRMRLANTPGEGGHALAHAPWKIAVGEAPLGLGMVADDELVAHGVTDADGNVVLSQAQQEALARAYCASPANTWLVYPGQTVRVHVAEQDPSWTDEEAARHALNAGDFSGGLPQSMSDDNTQQRLRYARDALTAGSPNQIYKKTQ